MGNLHAEITISGLLSRHNSAQDRSDDALWAEMYDKIRAIVEDDRYEPILPILNGSRES